MKRVIIIGGGFGGFYLAKRLSKHKLVKIILIDPKDFFIYKPLIHEVAVGEIPADTVKISYLESLKNIHHVKLKVKKILFEENMVILENRKSLKYDYLIVASGSNAFFPIKGSEKTLTLNNLYDAIKIKKILRKSSNKGLKISLIGEGFTGTELMAELATWGKKYGEIELHHFLYFKGYFLDKPSYDSIIKKQMKRLGVRVHLGEPVMEIVNNKIITKKGSYYSDIIFTCTGIKPTTIESDIEFQKGYQINEFCEIKGLKNAYAIGDVAKLKFKGGFAPQLGQIAQKEGVFISKDIIRREKNKKRVPIKIKIMGIFISIGKFYGVGTILDQFTLRGLFVWFIKRTYYFLNIFILKKKLELIKYYLTSLFLSKRYLK
ncbi:MAG: hypothetical protein EAX96_07125 [Candidatus Lokiarchaeota archaeon]|nr:hypothetical protein [Candidatus Lokiarchaeota archaeon]